MEQTTQQITQKPPLPIKTKIAAWLIIFISGIILLFAMWLFYLKYISATEKRIQDTNIILIFIIGLIFLIPSGYLLSKKKWALMSLLIMLFLILFILVGQIILGLLTWEASFSPLSDDNFLFILAVSGVLFLPFILLFLDRKNFFKIAS